MKNFKKILPDFFLAPLIGGMIFRALITVFFMVEQSFQNNFLDVVLSPLIFILIAPEVALQSLTLGLPVSLIIGIPVFFLSQKFQLNGIRSYIVIAILLSLIAPFFLDFLNLIDLDKLDNILGGSSDESVISVSLPCCLSVIIFWFIARPDKLTTDPKQRDALL